MGRKHRQGYDWDQQEADDLYEHAKKIASKKGLSGEPRIKFLSRAVEVIETITERTPEL